MRLLGDTAVSGYGEREGEDKCAPSRAARGVRAAGGDMRLVVRVLGLDLIDVELTTAEEDADPAASLDGGATGAMPVGFTSGPGDQRWVEHPVPEYGE